MIVFKHGVSPRGLRAPALLALLDVQPVFDAEGVDTVVTSTTDGEHTVKRSKHYSGDAVDLRSKHLRAIRREVVLEKLKQILGSDFVVLFESPDKPWQHYHIHYAPLYNPTVRQA